MVVPIDEGQTGIVFMIKLVSKELPFVFFDDVVSKSSLRKLYCGRVASWIHSQAILRAFAAASRLP